MVTIMRDDAPSTTRTQQRRAISCSNADTSATMEKPRSRQGVASSFRTTSASGAKMRRHHVTPGDEQDQEQKEEPQVLSVLDDETEPECEGEIELELVGDDLVEVQPSRRGDGGGVEHFLPLKNVPPQNVLAEQVPAAEQNHGNAEQKDPLELREKPMKTRPRTASSPRDPHDAAVQAKEPVQIQPQQHDTPTTTHDDDNRDDHDTTTLQPLSFPVLPTKYPPGVPRIDAALEEQVMEVVLRHAPLIAAAKSKKYAWNALARNSRGRYPSGLSAIHRIAWLRDVVSLPDHPAHKNLTPRLCELLRQFTAFQPWLTTNRKRPGEISADEIEEEEEEEQEEENEEEEAEEENELPRRRLRKNPRFTVHAPRDELLLRLVLAKRPFAEKRSYQNAQIWAEIARAIQSPLVRDAATGLARVRFLTNVFETKSHSEHTKLSRTLRELLTYFHASGQLPREDDDDHDSIESSEAQDEEGEKENGESTEVLVEPTSYHDTMLLREILRVRPFHKHGRQVTAKWERVALALTSCRRQLRGEKPRLVFPTARACDKRLRRLLVAVRNPTSRLRVEVLDHQLEMLQLINTLIQTRWPKTVFRETETHHELKHQIHSLLSKLHDDHESESENAEKGEDDEVEEEEYDKRQLPRRVVGHKRKWSRVQQSRDTQLLRDQVVALQSEVSNLRESFAGELQTLQSEVAKCRAQLTLQGTHFEHERRDHRRELRGVLEMLREEREAHTRETERLHRERTQEFAVLMRAITRSSTS